VCRFALQPVAEPTDGKQKERPVEAWTAGKKQQQPSGKVRGARRARAADANASLKRGLGV
jgi:hypothetical protein